MQISGHYVKTLLSALASTSDRVVLWWHDEPITGAELGRAIMSAARGLRRTGVGEGRKVTLLLATGPQMLIARYAANLLGATVLYPQSPNAVNPLDELSVDMQAELLAASHTTLLVVDAQNLARARKIAARMPIRPALATLGGLDGPDVVDLSSAPASQPVELGGAAPTGTAVVTFTSGTTGRPKGVPRSFSALDRVVATGRTGGPTPTMLISTPLHGPTGASWTDAVLTSEGTVVLHQGFDPAAVLAAIPKYRITRLCLTPPQLYALVDHPARATTDTSSVQTIIYSGCTASPRRIAQAVEAFGPILTQVYGMTETTAISILGAADHTHSKLLNTVGRPLSTVQMAIRDPRTHEDLPMGQAGEICVRSPYMMEGYWHDPEATARRLRNGWLHTGDVGYLDGDGYLHLVDRLDRMIKTRGIKVYPAAIEDVLLARPEVGQASVFKVVDADEVEHIHAAVVPHAGAEMDIAALRAHIERELSAAHVPVQIRVLAALPLLDSGKPDTRRLALEVASQSNFR